MATPNDTEANMIKHTTAATRAAIAKAASGEIRP